ncbi:MAG: type II secretion system protein [Synergistaceae bacterium]|nr:type II secretion system protein [Synergistaceae bacterium]MBQ9595329.1 type II secretion system protein [Synergistaceae bacterium]
MKKKFYARKGFTLVELLIVIVVIGILSAMMMLSSTEAMSSAKASNIASNLRNLKTATLAWYADHTDWVSPDLKVSGGKEIESIVGTESGKANILKYFNNEGSMVLNGQPTAGEYGVRSATISSKRGWYVGYTFANNETSVREKLAGRAKTLGLKFGSNTASSLSDTPGDNMTVWMKVLGEAE